MVAEREESTERNAVAVDSPLAEYMSIVAAAERMVVVQLLVVDIVLDIAGQLVELLLTAVQRIR